MEVLNATAMISLAFALLGAAAVYGTDVFFCVVGRTALPRISDAALVETMGRFHEVADRRMPMFGAIGIVGALASIAFSRVSWPWALSAVAAQVLWIVRRVHLGPYKFGGERCDIAPFCRVRRGFGRRPHTLGCACRDWRHFALRGGVCIGRLCDLRWIEAQPVEAIALAGHRDYQSRPFRIDLDLAA